MFGGCYILALGVPFSVAIEVLRMRLKFIVSTAGHDRKLPLSIVRVKVETYGENQHMHVSTLLSRFGIDEPVLYRLLTVL